MIPAADQEPRIRQLAGRLPETIRLGTSSWYFPGWEGLVWGIKASQQQVSRHGLVAYAKHPLLRTVGVDRTFYGPVDISVYRDYSAQTPDDFRLLYKVPRLLTEPYAKSQPNPRFLDAGYFAERFLEPLLAGSAGKAAAVVFQFTPNASRYVGENFPRFRNRLEALLNSFSDALSVALEFRHPQTLRADLYELIAQSHSVPCLSVHPQAVRIADQIDWFFRYPFRQLIFRWNLNPALSYAVAKARYSPFARLVDEDPETRRVLAAACRCATGRGLPVLGIINNKAEGSAPLSVIKLAQAIVNEAIDDGANVSADSPAQS